MRILTDPKLANQFGEAGYLRYLDYFSSDKMAKKYYNEIIKWL